METPHIEKEGVEYDDLDVDSSLPDGFGEEDLEIGSDPGFPSVQHTRHAYVDVEESA